MNPILMIKQYINIIIGVAIAGLTFYLSSLYYNHKIDNINKDFDNYKFTTEKNILSQKLSIETQNNKFNKENLELNNKLKDIENEKFKIYNQLQIANRNLVDNTRNGTNRLYINADCTRTANNTDTKAENNTTSTMDNEKNRRVAINAADAAAIIQITSKGDEYKGQLDALQEWVNNLIENNNKDIK